MPSYQVEITKHSQATNKGMMEAPIEKMRTTHELSRARASAREWSACGYFASIYNAESGELVEEMVPA